MMMLMIDMQMDMRIDMYWLEDLLLSFYFAWILDRPYMAANEVPSRINVIPYVITRFFMYVWESWPWFAHIMSSGYGAFLILAIYSVFVFLS